MPVIPPPPYSKKNVQWSMYKIVDSKWKPQPLAEEDYVDVPKYKKYTKNWFSRNIINILDSYNHRPSAFAQHFIEMAEEYEQELEQARLEEARLVMIRFQELIARSRGGAEQIGITRSRLTRI